MRIIHTSDFHGALTEKKADAIENFRTEDGLFFDCGDLIKTGNLGVPLKPDPGWNLLKRLGCTASVLGNRETHPLRTVFAAKLEGASQPILVSNLIAGHEDIPSFQPNGITIDTALGRIGVFGLMVPMATSKMKTASAWSCRWESPVAACARTVQTLQNANFIILLSHLGYRQDKEIALNFPQINLILGGHSHTVLNEPERVQNTWISHTGSHGNYAGVYDFDGANLNGKLEALPTG